MPLLLLGLVVTIVLATLQIGGVLLLPFWVTLIPLVASVVIFVGLVLSWLKLVTGKWLG